MYVMNGLTFDPDVISFPFPFRFVIYFFLRVSEDLRAQPDKWREANVIIHGYPKVQTTLIAVLCPRKGKDGA